MSEKINTTQALEGLKGIKDSANVILRQKASQKIALYSDYCQETSFEFKSSSDYAKRKGVKAIRWDKDREGTFKMSTEVFELRWLPILLGGEFKAGDVYITRRVVLDITNGKTAALKEEPKAGTMQVYVLDSVDQVTQEKELIATAESSIVGDVYKYDTANKTFTLDSSLNGRKIVVYFIPAALPQGQTFSVSADKFPINYEIEGDTACRSTNGEDSPLHFHILNCKPVSEISLNFSVDNIAKIDMTFDMFVDPGRKDFLDISIIPEE